MCFRLTNEGVGACDGEECGIDASHKGESVDVMVTNHCPYQGNEQWCAVPNKYGYMGHFDLAVSPPGWGNVVVSFEGPMPCPGKHLTQPYQECKCAGQRPSR